jgi:hypothetical protein
MTAIFVMKTEPGWQHGDSRLHSPPIVALENDMHQVMLPSTAGISLSPSRTLTLSLGRNKEGYIFCCRKLLQGLKKHLLAMIPIQRKQTTAPLVVRHDFWTKGLCTNQRSWEPDPYLPNPRDSMIHRSGFKKCAEVNISATS